MDDIPERYSLQNIEQMRGIADPLRLRIFEALTQRAMTATQVGEELQIAAPKAHYHVRELERLGLVKLVETRERGGILEKYYRAVARVLNAPPQLLRSIEPGEAAAAVAEVFTNLSHSFLTAMGRYVAAGDEASAFHRTELGGGLAWMTPEEFNQAVTTVYKLFEGYRARRGLPGEREVSLTMIGYDAQLAEQDDSELQPATPDATGASAQPSKPSGEPRQRKVSVVGALVYTRDDLERVVAAGERLDIDVIGYLSFSDDVSAKLVDRAIAHLRYRGMLSASHGVIDALKGKEK